MDSNIIVSKLNILFSNFWTEIPWYKYVIIPIILYIILWITTSKLTTIIMRHRIERWKNKHKLEEIHVKPVFVNLFIPIKAKGIIITGAAITEKEIEDLRVKLKRRFVVIERDDGYFLEFDTLGSPRKMI